MKDTLNDLRTLRRYRALFARLARPSPKTVTKLAAMLEASGLRGNADDLHRLASTLLLAAVVAAINESEGAYQTNLELK